MIDYEEFKCGSDLNVMSVYGTKSDRKLGMFVFICLLSHTVKLLLTMGYLV